MNLTVTVIFSVLYKWMHVDSFIVGFFLYTSLRMFILSLQLYQFKHVSNTITWNDKHLYSNTLSHIYRCLIRVLAVNLYMEHTNTMSYIWMIHSAGRQLSVDFYQFATLCRETIKCGLLSVCYTLQGDN